jgi:hypothetical protein
MNPFMKTVGKALRMDSDSALSYVSGPSKNAKRLRKKAGYDTAAAVKARQRQLGARYGATAVGLGVLGSQGKNRSSYRPQRPTTQAPSGSGRYA